MISARNVLYSVSRIVILYRSCSSMGSASHLAYKWDMLTGKQETIMAIITGEVVPDPHGSRTFLAICKYGDEMIASWPVRSTEEGERQIVEALKGLQKKAEDDGW